jgi:hypothetical protein
MSIAFCCFFSPATKCVSTTHCNKRSFTKDNLNNCRNPTESHQSTTFPRLERFERRALTVCIRITGESELRPFVATALFSAGLQSCAGGVRIFCTTLQKESALHSPIHNTLELVKSTWYMRKDSTKRTAVQSMDSTLSRLKRMGEQMMLLKL